MYENRVIPFVCNHVTSTDKKRNEITNNTKETLAEILIFCFEIIVPISRNGRILVIDIDMEPNEFKNNNGLKN